MATTASAKPASPAPSGAASAKPTTGSDVSWLVINTGSEHLGVLELRVGKPGVLKLESKSEDAKKFESLWKKIAARDGIAVDMHLPPKSGKGRGPYGTRIFRVTDKDYASVAKMEIEKSKSYAVKEVRAFNDAAPPASIGKLVIHRNGVKLGTLNFATPKPTFELQTKDVDGKFVKGDWEFALKKETLRVWYHRTNAGSGELVALAAKPGDLNYARVFRAHLIVNEYYDAKRGYKLDVIPK